MILLVHSARDIAGLNIAKQIFQDHHFTKTSQTFQESPVYQTEFRRKQIVFITLQEEAVHAQSILKTFPNSELVVFISRHSSQSGTPTLSVHTPGNLGKADLGGLPRTVSVSPAGAMQAALKGLNRLKQEMNLDYEVSYEGTHHGPCLEVPAMFVELGSSEKQWRDQAAAAAVAQAAMEAIATFGETGEQAVLGIGGTHYNQKFTQMALDDEEVFGHMIPKYALSEIDKDVLSQCIKRTHEKVACAVLDWKGIQGQEKPKILSMLKQIGLPVKKV